MLIKTYFIDPPADAVACVIIIETQMQHADWQINIHEIHPGGGDELCKLVFLSFYGEEHKKAMKRKQQRFLLF